MPTRMKGVTFQNTFKSYPKPLKGTLLCYCFRSILRTCRRESTTRSLQRRQKCLIKSDQSQQSAFNHVHPRPIFAYYDKEAEVPQHLRGTVAECPPMILLDAVFELRGQNLNPVGERL